MYSPSAGQVWVLCFIATCAPANRLAQLPFRKKNVRPVSVLFATGSVEIQERRSKRADRAGNTFVKFYSNVQHVSLLLSPSLVREIWQRTFSEWNKIKTKRVQRIEEWYQIQLTGSLTGWLAYWQIKIKSCSTKVSMIRMLAWLTYAPKSFLKYCVDQILWLFIYI